MVIDKNKVKRNKSWDKFFRYFFMAMALLSSSFIVIIILFVCSKGISPFLPNYEYGQVDFIAFLTGTIYRQDQGIYGVGFIIINTILSAFLALLIAFPISVLTALFIAKIAPKKLGAIMQNVVELLASVPSIVYGVFAAGVITEIVKYLASLFGYSTFGGSSLLAVIMLLAIMIFPTLTSLSITAIRSVDPSLEHASLALGATETQTNFKVVLAGLKETTGLDYDIRFSVGLVLIVIIFVSNFILNFVKKRIGNTV